MAYHLSAKHAIHPINDRHPGLKPRWTLRYYVRVLYLALKTIQSSCWEKQQLVLHNSNPALPSIKQESLTKPQESILCLLLRQALQVTVYVKQESQLE